jgi:imidazolonepropionase
MITLIQNIGCLYNVRDNPQLLRGISLSELPSIRNAFLLVEDGLIKDYGTMAHLPEKFDSSIDAEGRHAFPSWCDSHTHLVFAGSRENEFVDKLKGLSYADIAAKGGGILNSAKKLQETSFEILLEQAKCRLQELIRMGTGALEIKSGYGLSVEAELKMLRVIQALKATSPIPIRSTLLAAHAYPSIYKENHQDYLDLILNDILPVVAEEKLADYVDVFCETGFFSVSDMETICEAAIKYGIKPKLHVNQLNSIGGLQAAIKLKALSVDHLETMTDQDIQDLAASSTIGTMLPTAAFFLRMPYQPACEMIAANCALALASDFNPGSSPSGNMNLVVSISCIQMKMLPEEAINAASLNGAYAMELADQVGSITKGKLANLFFTKPIPNVAYLPYAFGSNLIEKIMLNGNFIQ